jgi:hypothetical protein
VQDCRSSNGSGGGASGLFGEACVSACSRIVQQQDRTGHVAYAPGARGRVPAPGGSET